MDVHERRQSLWDDPGELELPARPPAPAVMSPVAIPAPTPSGPSGPLLAFALVVLPAVAMLVALLTARIARDLTHPWLMALVAGLVSSAVLATAMALRAERRGGLTPGGAISLIFGSLALTLVALLAEGLLAAFVALADGLESMD